MLNNEAENNPLREHLFLALIGSFAASVIEFLPIMVGAVSDYLYATPDVAGFIFMSNFLGIAIGTLVSIVAMGHVSIKKCALLGILLISFAELWSAFIINTDMLAFVRFCSGLASGIISGCVAAAITLYPRQKRGFGLYMLGMFVASGIGLFILPFIIDSYGTKGLFISLAVLGGVSLILLHFLTLPATSQAVEKTQFGASPLPTNNIIILCLLGCVLFLMIGVGGSWAFYERLGIAWGLDIADIIFVLSVSAVCGFATFFVERSEKLLKSHYLILLGVLTTWLSIVFLSTGIKSFSFYTISLFLTGIGWAYTVPVIQGKLDHISHGNKNTAALSMLMYWCGLSFGLWIHGYILNATESFQITLFSCGLFYTLSLLCSLSVVYFSTLKKQLLATHSGG
ncbi:MFS transporter [Alteromonas sp. 14N.309.X.WAT.G.H12]|uniref:MFS transporter n=1 Tax=Alteromonas sp. 14N.309.X.WAT.G.H12 TaxID=3120824 RepID=UPI002FD122F2